MPVVQDEPLPDFAVTTHINRRRSGRLDIENPHLIEMLRNPDYAAIDEAVAEISAAVNVGPATRLDRAAFPFIILMTACFWAVILGVLWRTL